MGTKKIQSPQEMALEELMIRIRKFVQGAKRSDGKEFKVLTIQKTRSGTPTRLVGTVKDDNGENQTMCWNIEGKAMSQNAGLDLVTIERL